MHLVAGHACSFESGPSSAALLLQKEQVVKEYENGKAIPNQQVLAKMERVLGVKLRGKK